MGSLKLRKRVFFLKDGFFATIYNVSFGKQVYYMIILGWSNILQVLPGKYMSNEQKPWLFGVYRGLHYPVYRDYNIPM